MTTFELIRRGILTEASFAGKVVRVVLAVVIPTLLRWLLVGNTYGAPFVLYFPAILMIAVLLDWRCGAFTAAGSAVVGSYMFWPPEFTAVLGRQQVVVLAMFTLSAMTMIVIGHFLRSAVLELEQRAKLTEDFNRELQHRTKNTLQMVHALAAHAAKATSPKDFYATLGGRLGALAQANELLRFGAAEACNMQELIEAATRPFDQTRISAAGPTCNVSQRACTPLIMALHELGTNATKYGALSTEEGRVRIEWTTAAGEETIELCWREEGGPPVGMPTRRGLGSRLLSPNGDMYDVEVKYLPEGLVCAISLVRG